MTPPRSRWMGPALLFIAYFAAAKGGLLLDPVGGFATLVWPPTGIALGALLRWGPGLWPGVALGAFLANWTSGAPASAAAGIALGNTLEAVAAAVLLKRFFRFDNALERVRDMMGLFLAAGAGPLLSASIGTFSLWATDAIPAAQAGAVWKAWALGDLLGALTVAPAILTWGTASRRTDWRPAAEEAAFILCLVAASGLVFLPSFESGLMRFLSAYILIIPLFWAALRFNPSGTSLTILATSAFAVWGTAQGGGPFADGPLSERLFYLQAFTGAKAVASLLLAAAVAERRRAFLELQISEERLRRLNRSMEQTNGRLGASLKEKETLLREVHHRVKNNLQTVHSLLSLQAARVTDPAALEGLRDCRERVMTMALVHEKLYRSRDLARVDFAEYLRDLAKKLERSHSRDGREVRVEVEAAPVSLDVQEAVPCGLVVYELVSNALKHAFPDGRGGTVRVGLAPGEDGRVSLSVEDDGVGLPAGMDLARPGSLGLQLVRTLVGQLNGDISLADGGGRGAKFLVTLRAPEPAQAKVSHAV